MALMAIVSPMSVQKSAILKVKNNYKQLLNL
jgi:hypothetical protein